MRLGLYATAKYSSFRPVAGIGSSEPDDAEARGPSSRTKLNSAVVVKPIAAAIGSTVQPT